MRQFQHLSVTGRASNDNDGSFEAKKILIGILVDHLPLDGGPNRRVGLLDVQRESVGVGGVRCQGTIETASVARVHVVGRPGDRHVKDDRVNLGLRAIDRR